MYKSCRDKKEVTLSCSRQPFVCGKVGQNLNLLSCLWSQNPASARNVKIQNDVTSSLKMNSLNVRAGTICLTWGWHSICTYHPGVPGSHPKHTTYTSSIIVKLCQFFNKSLCLKWTKINKIVAGFGQYLKNNVFFKKWTNPGLFLFIFVLIRHKFYRKNVGFNGIRTRIVRIEGKHADHHDPKIIMWFTSVGW